MNKERAEAIIRIVVTAAIYIANLYGLSVDADAVVNAILTILSFAAIVWAWWRNNNITFAAQQGQMVVDKIKNEQKALKLKEKTDA